MGILDPFVKKKLDYLSNLPETDFPFISLYMNIHSHNLFEQAEKNRIFIKDSFLKITEQIKKEGRKDKLASFLKDEERITNFINTNLDSRSHGLAIFACDELNIFESFQSLLPFDNDFIIDTFPHLKQLSFQTDELENALVIMLDSKYSRIFNVKLGGLIFNELDRENMVHRFHKQGGWAQMRYQRHIEKHIHDHYKEIAEIAAKIIDDEHYENVILIGQEQEIKNFELLLPKRVKTQVININHLQMKENINVIMDNIVNDLYDKEKERELATVKDIIEKAMGKGHESIGMQDTIKLAKDGRVSVLAVVKDLVWNGFRCDECFYVTKDQYQAGCPKCNGQTKQTDLIEEAIRLTLKHGGKVEIVQDQAATELEKHEGIGAYLRY